MKKTVLSRGISFLLSLLLAISLMGCFACLFAKQTVADPGRITSAVTESGYVETLYGEIYGKWENLFAISGIPDAERMLSLLDKDTLGEDVETYFAGTYRGELTVDTQPLEKALQKELENYIAGVENADPEDPELQKNMADLVAACADEYRLSVRVPMLHTVMGKVTRIGGRLTVTAILATMFSLVLTVFLFFLQKHRRDTLYFVAVAAITDTVLLLGARIAAAAIRLVERLPLAQSALRDLAQLYVADLLGTLTWWGVGFCAASAVLVAAYLLTSLKKNRQPS